jgi:type IV fimbrial biogenesis protein FimT
MLRTSPMVRPSGFSLIELVVVITIVGILVSIAVPSYRYFTVSNRIGGEINGLLGDLQFARYEAIKEGLPVVACPANSAGTACNTTSTDWGGAGWIVMSNAASNGGAVVLRRQVPFNKANNNASKLDVLTGTSSLTSISFNREGFATIAGTTGSGMFSLHDSTNNASYTRCLVTSAAGAMYVILSGASVYSKVCS